MLINLLPAHAEQQNTLQSKQQSWQLYKEQDGIRISQFEHPNGLVEIRAIMQVNTSLSGFLYLLQDVDNAPQWLDNVYRTQVLEQINSKENIVYTQFSAPWPAQDRDMVTYSYFSQLDREHFILVIEDATAFLPPQEGYIRITDVKAKWQLQKLASGKTHIIYTAFADPGGALPDWLVNDLARKGAMNTFIALRQRLPLYQQKQHPDLLTEIKKEPMP
ncbi:START domain-containing protein [Vibrio sp. S11_S32]|uniref:START domain-containing protein n=2 Tax=Vibrionaceae TaxID=641 RepID=A0A5Q0TLS8_9VIBR|nr:START domain-containing protein [Vibrio sp. S11_S32]